VSIAGFALNENGNIPGFPITSMQRNTEDSTVPRTYPKGRTCEACPTKLSIYNPDLRCSVHQRFSAQDDLLLDDMEA
jgi:hypothetical protein